ncbi:MAG TPA: MaoC family dehydratase N-terminal domain-containing protein [Egibacteraceae bacterium]|nr:MaoC family dehydratase N-terminal domain-containing protein [Egibacteraceae bacterium]
MGHRYPAYRYEVGAEKLREYMTATALDGDDLAGALAADPPDVAPAGFAACFTIARGLQILFSDAELGLRASLVHTAQSFEFHRPVRRGDVLDCTASIADIAVRERLELLTVQIDCVEAVTGAAVVTSRGTLTVLQREDQADA